MLKKVLKYGAAVIAVISVVAAATGCTPADTSTTSATCAFILGDGVNGHDAAIHTILYPNQTINIGDNEVARYVPCNSRNYIIADPNRTQKNANGQKIGDRFSASIAYTSSGTKVKVFSSSYWTLNEDRAALNKFWEVCLKYTCASDNPASGTANFSTPGWNGMLGENFGPSVDDAAFNEVANFGDAIWKTHKPQLYEELGKQMSKSFSESVRTKTGYNENLFCGSGNSAWTGSQGKSDFTCSNVRITIDSVEPFDPSLGKTVDETTKARQDQNTNKTKYQAAKELYGSQAGYWLGLQDSIEKCRTAKVTCVVNIGSGANVSIPAGG